MENITMKLEPSTLNVLKHFATINPTLLLRKGSTLKTRSPAVTVAARATLRQAIPRDFAIFDLARFLNTLSLFPDPEITLDESFCTIKQRGASVRYLYADDRIIRPKQDREINIPNEYFSFTLNAADYAALRKGMSVLGLPEIAIVCDGQRLSLRALDARNKTADVFDLVIGETNKNFKAVIPAENLKIVPQDYQALISDKGIAYLKSIDGSMEYWICLSNHESEFGTE
jgi:hypothetical protein